jgi:outer membrane protein OmpA-like peptidoglycan-associated protein
MIMKSLLVSILGFYLIILSHIQLHAQFSDTVVTELIPLGKEINSIYADFAPVISADGSTMMFTSRRPVTSKELKTGKSTFERVFTSVFDKEKQTWSAAVPLDEHINVRGRNNSAIALSQDGFRMLLFRDDDKGNGDIYESSLKGDKWTEPVKLPEPVNTSYHESSAALMLDGKTMLLVSDRKGGLGGRDIWICSANKEGKWVDIRNAGAVINTETDEEGVFLHPDGKTLFFSSKGHGSAGGYDVYMSSYENGTFSTPINLGKPVNSMRHDVFFVLDASGKKGFIASSSSGGLGEEDIYEIRFKLAEKRGPKLTLLKGTIYDELTKLPVEADLEITDNTSSDIITRIKSNSQSGKYMASLPAGKNYGISVSAPGYLFQSVNAHIADTADYNETEKNIGLQKLEIGTRIVLNNIFYDFDKSNLREESKGELERLITLLNENPSMKIELGSHTDGLGTDNYNNRLSQERAQSVVDFLTSRGINASRVTARGYGKSQPVATNETEEGRQLNRRTEFKIIGK